MALAVKKPFCTDAEPSIIITISQSKNGDLLASAHKLNEFGNGFGESRHDYKITRSNDGVFRLMAKTGPCKLDVTTSGSGVLLWKSENVDGLVYPWKVVTVRVHNTI